MYDNLLSPIARPQNHDGLAQVLSSATFDDARNRVANAVSWGAVVVQPNAWNNLLTAFRTVNNTYMTSRYAVHPINEAVP